MKRNNQLKGKPTKGLVFLLLVAFAAVTIWTGLAGLCPVRAQVPSPTPVESNWVTDGVVSAIATTGNTTYIGGNFSVVGPEVGHGVPVESSTGQPAASFPKVKGNVNASAPDGSGGWYIGGDFTGVGGLSRNRLAHILSDGSVDPVWDPDADGTVSAIAVAGSNVYLGGYFESLQGGAVARRFLGAVDAATGVPTGWDPGPNYYVYALAASGSDIYVGGGFTTVQYGATTRRNIAALDGTTGVPTAWDPDANGSVRALALSGSTVYVGGEFTTFQGGATTRNRLAALDATTGVPTAWNPDPNFSVHAVAVSGSTVYAGGYFTTLQGGATPRNRLAAIDATTGVPTAWDPDPDGGALALAVSGSTVYAGGAFTTLQGGATARKYVAAIDATTGVPTAWNPSPSRGVSTILVSGSSVFIGGKFNILGGVTRNNLAAIDTDPSSPTCGRSTPWNPDANSSVNALAVSSSTVYAGGAFTTLQGGTTQRNRLAAIDATTGVPTAWNPNADGGVSAVAVSGSTVYAGGYFSSLQGGTVGREYLAAIDATTGVPTAWDPDPNDGVYTIAVSGSTVYAGGYFSSFQGGTVGREYLAAIDATTGVPTAWDPDPNAKVNAIAVSGSTVYAGGGFTTLQGGAVTRNRLASIDATTGVPDAWDPDLNGSLNETGAAVKSLSVYSSTVYVGGDFFAAGNNAHSFFAEFRAPSPTVTSITPSSGMQGTTVEVTNLAGTNFSDIGGNPTVKLEKAGQADITATNVNVVSGSRITCEFGLAGAVVGSLDVYVENPDGQSDTLAGGFTVNAPSTPTIDSVSPPEGPPGTTVIIGGTNFGDDRGSSYVTFNGVKATEYLSWSDTEIVVVVPEGATTGPVEVVTSAGGSNTDHDFTIAEKVLGSMAWIVAEGSTGEGFDTFILMQNPNNVPAPTAVAFSTEDGIADGTLLEIPPNSRTTLRLSDYMPDQWGISTLVAAEVPIVVERSMYWNSEQTAYPYEMMSGHANLGLPAPMEPGFKMDAESDRSTDQFFPEGSTAGFDTWILLFNPMEEEAKAKVTLMDETGPVVEEDVTIGPLSRKTVHLNKLLPDANQVATRVESDTFLAAERSMYWDPDASEKQPYEMIGGHSTSGSPVAANNWYVAEGSTGGGFETYILLQNPADTEAPVNLTFMDESGVANQATATMPAGSRSTFKVSDYVPDNFQVSTSVTSDVPVVAERSMYWDKGVTTEPSSMKDGHSTVGEVGTGQTWMVSEGSTGGGFDTFVLITNTENTQATVTVTFMTEDGPQAPFNVTVPANSRYTLRISDYLPDTFQVSTLVESDNALVVERSMYWDNREISAEGNFPARPYECIGGHSANGMDP